MEDLVAAMLKSSVNPRWYCTAQSDQGRRLVEDLENYLISIDRTHRDTFSGHPTEFKLNNALTALKEAWTYRTQLIGGTVARSVYAFNSLTAE